MTTDTAVRVTRMVVHEKGPRDAAYNISIQRRPLTSIIVPLEQIPYADYPEILINEHERTEMPFRYVKDAQGEPIMPKVSTEPPLRGDLEH